MKIVQVLGLALITPAFIETLTTLAKDSQWRVRMAVLELLGQLSVKFGREIYTESFESLFMGYLTSSAAAVREMGIIQSISIAGVFGSEWIISVYLPKVISSFQAEK